MERQYGQLRETERAGKLRLREAGMTLSAAPDSAAAYAASIQALAGDGAALRAGAVILTRAFLAERSAAARARLEAGGDGRLCAEAISSAHDTALLALHGLAAARLYPASNPSQAERLAVCATGGYGRGTLAPGSDIDLLFLFPLKQTAWCETVTESILYMLWDLGLKVGHAARSIDDCMREAGNDLTIRTALLETRLITGDIGLYQELMRRFDHDVMRGTAADFAHAKLEERDARVARAGASRYLVEPNVKEGKGGLRDLNTLFWIAKYVYRVHDAKELVSAGLFTEHEFGLFRRAEEFLWRVRCHMHFTAGRAEERLSFDMQQQVAAKLKYRKAPGQSPVERFMRHYFTIAKDVGDLTAILCAALEAREQKPRAMFDRFVGTLRRRRRTLDGARGFIVDHGRLTTASDDVFSSDPVNIIRMFWLADRHELPIHPDASRQVTLNLRHANEALRASPEANRLFLDILTSRGHPDVVLRRMHETGVLGRFIPEFQRIQSLMQFSMYHHYTVDEHTIRAIGNLAALEQGSLKEELPVASEVLPLIQNRRALYVALFLHDIGKGREEDHSVIGARLALSLCPRLGLTEAETVTVSWLIEHHLLMSNTSQHRDLADPRTIETFASAVQTMERLRLLLALTVCDIRAVGPGVWNGWKGQLLRALYWETEARITGEQPENSSEARAGEARSALRKALPDWDEARFARYAARHNAAYWIKFDPKAQVRHARLVTAMEASGETLTTETSTDKFRGVTAVTVLAPDHPRLLAILTGACAASGANIVEAQIYTTTDGLLLDTIMVSRAFDRDEDELRRAGRIAENIALALKGAIRLPEAVASRAAAAKRPAAFQVQPEVNIDNSPSKSGVLPDEVLALAKEIAKLPRLQLRGIMAIPDVPVNMGDDIAMNNIAIQEIYTPARAVFDHLKALNYQLDTLSIGMSADLEPAILAGSTMVRVGSAIFGARN